MRYTIAQLHKQGRSLRSIARTIEVHVSTVSRELRRNSHKRGYSAQHAQMLADKQVAWRATSPPLHPLSSGTCGQPS
ncbi:MAG: helix-turn-helix domain-containing protein [Porphyromonadaceae bacterium]|nr:helix-turn-helix domain-containing protein [Porphyromonadaceae bacterium]